MPKILLHSCCGPCTTYVFKHLSDNGFAIKGFFYNPNIRPLDEYEKRLLTMEYYASIVGLKVIYESLDDEARPDISACRDCYNSRLKKTAQLAKDLGFDCFCTTLLISPYQKHDLLKEIGEKAGKEAGIKFYYHDFRQGYRESRQMAAAMKLYMQKYCGCKELN
ncbi:MAG: epoxyqueuosine reductase QueH [Candidatus Saganbacteria bacterium]|nr:epoxyqueuosine reductase QueH [Candidatus Saganbacteria bacterium]